jgi:transposase-like protein
MATRFRKHRTRKVKGHGRKALKTRKMKGGLFNTLKDSLRKITNKAGITESSVNKMFREEEEKIQAMKYPKAPQMNFGYQIKNGAVKKL